jgi:hypothetical protein
VRPFGAIVFGRIGDVIGASCAFMITVSLMGFATFLVGVLPTYEQIGIFAPLILVTFRMLQGLALGGEYGCGRDLRRRTRARSQARPLHLVDPNDRDRWPLYCPRGHPDHSRRLRRCRL